MTRYLWFYWAVLALLTLVLVVVATRSALDLVVLLALALAAWTGGWVSAELAARGGSRH